MTHHWITAERNSPSDEQLLCLEVLAQKGDFVAVNTVIAEMEGAKAIFEVLAGSEGFFYPLIEQGQHILVGKPIGVVTAENLSEEQIEQLKSNSNDNVIVRESNVSTQQNMSSAALKLFEKLDQYTKNRVINEFAHSHFVREIDLINAVESLNNNKSQLSQKSIAGWKLGLSETKGLPSIYFVGGGFGALQVLDIILEKHEYHLEGYFSDNTSNILDEIGVPRIGNCSEKEYSRLLGIQKGSVFAITVGMSPIFRFHQFEILNQLGAKLPNIIDSSVLIGRNLEIGMGNVIMANVHIGADVRIVNSNFISSNSTVEHHNVLGSGNCFGPQIATSGNVKIGDMCRFGAAIVVEPKIEIGSDVTIASNMTITADIKSQTIVKATGNSRVTPK